MIAALRLSAIALLTALLAGCSGMAQVSSQSAENFPSDIAGSAEITAVTTRKPVGPKQPWFGRERGDASMVRVNLASPYKAGRFSMAAAGLADWKIAGVEPLSSLTLAGDAGGTRDVLVYVHGFNETFESATLDAARLSDALAFRGDTVVFSWPSRDSVFDYMADRESAVWSRDALEDVFATLLTDPKIGRVHVVAHSMGGMLTVEALRQVYSSKKGFMSHFGAIVFASPDIDMDGFSASVRRMGEMHRQMTVITSLDDRALALSASLSGGKRVGRSQKAALEQLGIKVVDTSGMSKGLLRHDIFLHDKGVQQLVTGAIADARSGRPNSSPSPFPVMEPNLPVTQEPLAALPTPAEPAQAPISAPPAATYAPAPMAAPAPAAPMAPEPVQAPVAVPQQ
jgi:esterase/lipase superfamily enzyme